MSEANTVATAATSDLAARTAPLRASIGDLHRLAAELTISEATIADASDILGMVAGKLKAAEETRLTMTRPLRDASDNINAFFREMTAGLRTIDLDLRGRVSAWHTAQAAARAALAAQVARSEAQTEQATLADSGEAPAPVLAVPAGPVTVRSGGGTMTPRTVWRFEVVDAAQVPDDYWQINEELIGKAVRAGVRTIPGVRVYSEQALTVRSK